MAAVSVAEILQQYKDDLALEAVGSGKHLKNKVRSAFLQKVGLALTGRMEFVMRNRIQIFGQAEISYIVSLPLAEQERLFAEFFTQRVVCCIVTRNLAVPEIMLDQADLARTPVLRSKLSTPTLMDRLTKLLEPHFAKSASVHGVLLDVYGVGVLILGDSGIGKSECALDLVSRGHRLVADDTVDLVRQGPLAVYGHGPEIIKYHMEIRGLGIINIKELFGISAIRDRKKIQLIIKLVAWERDIDYERIGIDDDTDTILGVPLPRIVLPVRPGRNLTTIIEVAARNQLLKLEGFHAAKEFQKQLLAKLNQEAGLAEEEPE